MTIRVKTLAPLHIGCGESYSGLNYILDKNLLYYIEPDKMFAFLKEQKKIEEYVQWIETESDKIANIEQNRPARDADKEEKKEFNKRLNSVKNAFILKQFSQKNRITLDSFKKMECYHLILRDRIYDSAEVQRFIHQQNHPYLPGTEIKGAIRTAILFDAIEKDHRNYEWLKKEIIRFGDDFKNEISRVENQKKPDKRTKEFLNKRMADISEALQERILNSSAHRKDAKYDILKYLFISDSNLVQAQDKLEIAHVEPFNTRFSKTFQEYVKPHETFEFKDLKVNQYPLMKEKLGFTEQQNKYVSKIEEIARCCHDFSEALLNHEIEFFKKCKKDDIVNQLNIISRENTIENPVLRIGKDEGYLSLTMGLVVKKNDCELYENVLIHATKGTSYDSRSGGLLPKTRKIVYYDGKEYTSGWIKLLLNDRADVTQKPAKAKDIKTTSTQPTTESLKSLQNKFGGRK